METAGRRGRPSADQTRDRQDAVIRAARAEFLAKGYRGGTMNGIAAAAGVSKRSLYLWHGDKAALFHSCIIDGALDLRLPRLDPTLDPRVALTAFGAILLPAVSTDTAIRMTRLLFREAPDFEVVRAALTEGARMVHAPAVEYFKERGYDDDVAARLVEMFVAALTSRMQRATLQSLPPSDVSEDMEHLAMVVGLFCGGLPEPS